MKKSYGYTPRRGASNYAAQQQTPFTTAAPTTKLAMQPVAGPVNSTTNQSTDRGKQS